MGSLRLRPGLLIFALAATTGWAQDQTTQPAQPAKPKEVMSNGSLLHTLLAAPVIGHPYSAVQVHTTDRKLADGTDISHHGHHIVARDSAGRVHVEVRMGNGKNGQPDPVMVFVLDPVAHTLTSWMTGATADKKQAVVYKLPADLHSPKQTPVEPASASTRPQPVVTVENLGTDSIEGVSVSVEKTTTVVPIGRSGNDAPITKTHEVWTSQDLRLAIKEQWNDPRTGTKTVELSKLALVEPDPGLFHPPSGYAVKDALQTLKEFEKKLGETQN